MTGDDVDERLFMAERLTICILNEFVDGPSLLLNLIGCEGLFSLVNAPRGQHAKLIEGGSIVRLIRLIQRPLPAAKVQRVAGHVVRPEGVLVAAMNALRTCCVVAGFVPFIASQTIVCDDIYTFLPVLSGIVKDRRTSTAVRAETLLTLGFITLSKKQNSANKFVY